MRKNLTSLELGVRHNLDELVESDSHWSSTRIKIFLNEGVGDVVTRLPSSFLPDLAAYEKQNLTQGIAEYTFTTEHLRIDSIDMQGKVAHIIPFKFTNVFTSNELIAPSIANPYIVLYGKYLFVYPTPTMNVYNALIVYYIKLPTELVEPTDYPETPGFTHDWIIEYATYLCLFEDGNPKAKDIYKVYLEKFVKYQPKEQG